MDEVGTSVLEDHEEDSELLDQEDELEDQVLELLDHSELDDQVDEEDHVVVGGVQVEVGVQTEEEVVGATQVEEVVGATHVEDEELLEPPPLLLSENDQSP